MKKILHIISSPRGVNSFSIQLGNHIISKLQGTDPDSTVRTFDLGLNPLPHLEEAHLTSFFTPPEQRTTGQLEAVKHSDEAIALVMWADIIVIGVPMFNFGITSTLKAWLDHIARAGVTFAYSEKGAEGLIKNKKVYFAIATGAVYSEGPWKAMDFTENYLRSITGFLGMTDVTVYRVEGTSVPGIKETALGKALDAVQV